MAQYQLTHCCGHEWLHEIDGRRQADQADRIAREICIACQGRYLKWPRLTGSGKEVAWAGSIRTHVIGQLSAWHNEHTGRVINRWPLEQVGALGDLLTAIWCRAVLRHTAAEWWIANRHRIDAATVESLTDQDRAEYKDGIAKIVTILKESGVWPVAPPEIDRPKPSR